MRRALPTIALSAAGLTWLLHAQGVIDATGTRTRASPSPSSGAPNASTPPPPTGAASPAPTTRSTAAAGSVDGPVVDTRYGPVQVRVILQGRRLADVRILEYPNEARRSQSISAQSLPLLRQEALSAQSAQIDTVSGATYTSDAYARSLQAALDSAGIAQP